MYTHASLFRSTTKWLRFGAVFVFMSLAFLVAVDRLASGQSQQDADYDKWISESYDFRFGADKRFSPGSADSFNGKFIPGDNFIPASRCAACHTDVHPQWSQSAPQLVP